MHPSGRQFTTMLQKSNSCFSVPIWIQGARLPAQYHDIDCPISMKVPFWGSGGEILSYHGDKTYFPLVY